MILNWLINVYSSLTSCKDRAGLVDKVEYIEKEPILGGKLNSNQLQSSNFLQ